MKSVPKYPNDDPRDPRFIPAFDELVADADLLFSVISLTNDLVMTEYLAESPRYQQGSKFNRRMNEAVLAAFHRNHHNIAVQNTLLHMLAQSVVGYRRLCQKLGTTRPSEQIADLARKMSEQELKDQQAASESASLEGLTFTEEELRQLFGLSESP